MLGGSYGKSAFVSRFVSNLMPQEYDPVIEEIYTAERVYSFGSVKVDLVDTPGQEEFSAMRDQWIRHYEGIILMISAGWGSSARSLLDEAKALLAQIYRVRDTTSLPLIVVRNRCDRDRNDYPSISEFIEELHFLCKVRRITLCAASALTGEGVERAVEQCVRLVLHHRGLAGTKKKPIH